MLADFAPVEAVALALAGPPAWLLVVDEARTLEIVRRVVGARGVVLCTATPPQLARVDPAALPPFDRIFHAADRTPPFAGRAQAVPATSPPHARTWRLTPAETGWQPLGCGGDYVVFHRDQEVLRLARHPALLPTLRREQALLAWLAPRLPCAVPEIREVFFDDTWLAARARLLPGRPLTTPLLGPALAVDLAAFLAALHAAPPASAPAITAVRRLDTTPARLWARLRARVARYLLHRGGALRLSALLADLPPRLFDAVARWLATPPTDEPFQRTYIHGDLVGNLLVDADDRLAGVLDWGDTGVGDPARDLGGLAALGGAAALDRILAAYPPSVARHRVTHYWRLELVDVVSELAFLDQPLAPWLPRLGEAFDV
ncbi:MAG: aminoglycoside phosphotransferase family protein [Myxococcales bacterium]|nr:aminoglycoside phosphotransferase family protein [Myxococcales bacterium]